MIVVTLDSDYNHSDTTSRFWGFVPENHIVGKAIIVLCSFDSEESFFDKMRWDRICKMVN